MLDSCNEAKKRLTNIGLDYENRQVCPIDHVLFKKNLTNKVQWPQRSVSCYLEDVKGNKVPKKVLRHSPLNPHNKHVFRFTEIASIMSWHVENRSTHGIMQTPAASHAWKHIDTKWPMFE